MKTCRIFVAFLFLLIGVMPLSAQDTAPFIIPPEQGILFSSNRDHAIGLYYLSPTTEAITPIVKFDRHTANLDQYDLSPDGRTLAYVTEREDTDGEFDPEAHEEISLLDMQTGIVATITDNQERDGFPLWSPDGQHLAYLSNGYEGFIELHIYDMATLEDRIILNTADLHMFPLSEVAWSPDSKQLVVGIHVAIQDEFQPLVISRLETINIDGTNLSPLTPNDILVYSPMWLKSDVILALCSGQTRVDICSVDMTTKIITLLTTNLGTLIDSGAFWGFDVSSQGDFVLEFTTNLYAFNLSSNTLKPLILNRDKANQDSRNTHPLWIHDSGNVDFTIPTYEHCGEGVLPPMLLPGVTAYVSHYGTGNHINATPSKDSKVLGTLAENESVKVLNGPVCADEYSWVQIQREDGSTGWTPETNGHAYWLIDY